MKSCYASSAFLLYFCQKNVKIQEYSRKIRKVYLFQIQRSWVFLRQPCGRQVGIKRYLDSIAKYTGRMLLVGINYDKKTKKHACEIIRA